MISFFSKIFIKDHNNLSEPSVRRAYGVLCGGVGIGFNVILFLLKMFAGIISGSIAITADAFNNLSDAGSSIITLVGFKMAGQKPDPDHPFGHGRIEYIAGMLVSVFILFMAFELVKSSFIKILHPVDITCNAIIVAILIVSILVKLYMAFYNYKIGKKIDSAAMKATATDSFSDMLSTSVVLIATLVSYYTSLIIDGYCGVVVGIFIGFAGINALKETISPLLGQPPEPEFVQAIEDIVLSHDGIIGIHDLIVHNYGPGRVMISLHAEIPADSDMLIMHDLIDNIEHDLRDELHCDAVIHMDPVCINDEETKLRKKDVIAIIEDIDPELTLHDFRIVKGPTHTNLIFDVVVPYKFRYTDTELVNLIKESVANLDGNYFAVIDVDKKYAKTTRK